MCAFCVHLRPSHLCHLMPFYAPKFGAIPQVNCICLVSARRSLILSWVRLQSAFRPRGEQRRHADSWLQRRSRAWSLTGTLMKMIKKDEEWWRMMNRMGMTSRNRIILKPQRSQQEHWTFWPGDMMRFLFWKTMKSCKHSVATRGPWSQEMHHCMIASHISVTVIVLFLPSPSPLSSLLSPLSSVLPPPSSLLSPLSSLLSLEQISPSMRLWVKFPNTEQFVPKTDLVAHRGSSPGSCFLMFLPAGDNYWGGWNCETDMLGGKSRR